ncbi:acetolactate synthase large subunit [Sagittula stellata E-37]|uniref:Acetolactate synthase large subunit n=1 Tax=Sagittula stellata (strain ATCC 700073 / DSM 11524 / E-37) TaxID=388399 RepID=A3K838_SAGS3|nr:acetolactate synthase large subunit [Sagittula stellata E-37]
MANGVVEQYGDLARCRCDRLLLAEPACQFGCRFLAFQGFQRDLRLELRRMQLAFRHL